MSTDPIPFPTTDLHVYLIDDGAQWWYVAKSEEHALEQFVDDLFGGTVESYREGCPDTTVTLLPDDGEMTIAFEDSPCADHEDDDEEDYDEYHEETQTHKQWAAEHGEGCLCSSEY